MFKRTSNAHQLFLKTSGAVTMKKELLAMTLSSSYNTSSRSDDADEYVQKHLDYVSQYPYIDLSQYVNNLKLKSRK